MERHSEQNEALGATDADTFIPYTKKSQEVSPTVSTAASSFATEDVVFADLKEGVYVGACSSGVAFPSPITLASERATPIQAPPQGKLYLAGAAGSGVDFPSPFKVVPETRPGSAAVPPVDPPCLSASSAGVAFPSPFEKAKVTPTTVVPLPGGLAGASSGVNFPSPFKALSEALSAATVSVPFLSMQGPSLAGCSSAGVSFPSPLASA
jgi:hypothetical protein